MILAIFFYLLKRKRYKNITVDIEFCFLKPQHHQNHHQSSIQSNKNLREMNWVGGKFGDSILVHEFLHL